MTRDELGRVAYHKILNHKCLILQLATGTGKTKVAIDLVNRLARKKERPLEVLLLVAKTVHKQSWKDEIAKWGGIEDNIILTTECYQSLKKHVSEAFDIVICDEVHHLQSELRQEMFKTLTIKDKIIGLSATVPRDLRHWLFENYDTSVLTVSLQDAITEHVLPKPEIILVPLHLDKKTQSELVEVNPKMKGPIRRDEYKRFWKYKISKTHALLKATPYEKLCWFNNEVLAKKNAYERVGFPGLRFQWLRMCNERLRFLAYQKNGFVKRLLQQLKDKRTLTFCFDIAQTEVLGKYCIHSKNGQFSNTLNMFNAKSISHITACQMLNEGVNLTECQYGIFANLNSSKTIQVQRFGRLLRHKHPKIIIPYYVHSREEEIVKRMLEDYDKSLIRTQQIENII